MKRILSYISLCAFATAVFAGCSQDVEQGRKGEGRLIFSVKMNGAEITRANTPDDCVIKIGNAQGYLYIYNSLADVPAELWLLSGSDYFVTVEGGAKVAYGWDTPYYKGTQSFSITAGQNTIVEVNCPIQNTLFTVGFDETVTGVLSDYSVTLFPVAGDTDKKLVFDQSNPEAVAYVMLEAGQTSIDWTFDAVHPDRDEVTKSGTLTGLEARKKYELTFRYTVIEKTGEFELNVTVDESVVEVGHDITIYQSPRIVGMGFDLTQIQRQAADYKVVITASADIETLTLSGSVFGEGYDLLDPANQPADYGVVVQKSAANIVHITFTTDFVDLAGIAYTEVMIAAADTRGKTNSVPFKLSLTTVSVNEVARKDTWATFATVNGVVLEEGSVRFAYRTQGGEWQYADAVKVSDNHYSSKITGLTPATSYEVSMEVDGDVKGETVSFTTEAATQPKNAGFEEHGYSSSDGDYFYSNAGDKFWDCGNKGSMTLDISVTTSSTDARPGSDGTRSVKMQSAYPNFWGIGKFAAASIYSGHYVGTVGMDGKVDFGRAFTSRPSSMTVWYKASPGTVDHSGGVLSKGATDVYQIMVALTDWNAPHQIYTADQSTFLNYETNPGIIAFGEISSSTTVSDWTEATIDLKYRSLDRIPKYIVIMACASRYGDYFTGSTNSVMYVDDIELVYDDNIVLQN